MPLGIEQFRQNTIADGYSPSIDDADQCVQVPKADGEVDFMKIGDDLATAAGLRTLPIRLLNGRQRGTGGYGITHILYQHAATLARFDYYSVQDYVDDVAGSFDAVYAGRDDRTLIVRKKGSGFALDRLLVLELSRNGQFYSVVSGWVVSSRRPVDGEIIAERVNKNGVEVWERRAPRSVGPGEPIRR